MGDEGAAAFKNNETLTELNLGYSKNIGKQVQALIAKQLNDNRDKAEGNVRG
jgi:hypothetical protein